MPRKKPLIRRLHKIKIHKNRWLIWTVAYLVFVTIALVGYIKVTDINFDTTMAAQNVFMPWHTYQNTQLGFSFRYPANWLLNVNPDSSVVLSSSDTSQVNLEVDTYKANATQLIRRSLKILNEVAITVDGVKATYITNDLGNGQTESVVILPSNNHIYVISGSRAHVDNTLQTFNLTAPKE